MYLFYIFQGFILTSYFLKDKKELIFLSLITTILFSGLRYGVGNDYFTYYDYFLDISKTDDLLEPGFYLLVRSLNILGFHPFIIFFVFSLLTYLAIYKVFSSFKLGLYPFALYLFTPGLFLNSLHLIRQPISIAILALGIVAFVENRSFKLFIFFGILAISFHLTAIIPFFLVILVILFFDKECSKSFYLLLLFSSFILSIGGYVDEYLPSVLFMFPDKFHNYSSWNDAQSPLKVIINLIIISFIILNKSKLYDYSKNNFIYFNFLIIGNVINFSLINFTVITRIVYYFNIFSILIFTIQTNKMNKIPQNLFRLLLVFCYMIASFDAINSDSLTNDNPANIWNYRTVFFLL